MSVETTETGGGGGKAGGDGSGGETGGESAKDAKAREARAKKHLAELEKQHKAEAAERAHQEMMLNLAEAAIIAGGDKRKTELAAIEFDAIRKSLAVTGSAQERAAAIQLIEAEAGQKLLELRAKFAKEDEQAAKEHLDQLLADEDAAEVEREEKFQQAFENALLNQTQLDQAIYDAKYASLQAKLALEESFDGKTSKLYRATYKELTKLEKDKNASDIEGAKKAQKAKADIAKMGLKHASDVLGSTLDLLFQDEQARKQNHGIYVALSAAKILTDGYREVQSIWEYSAENPANGPTAGAAGIAVGAVQTALAVARTTLALANIGGGGGFSFAKGGRTGSGMSAGADTATMMQMQGLRVGGNGKLIDDSGFAVAGIVHENEYVIPQWLRADPQVAAVENWLEARRLRGYADGGATSSTAAPASAAPLPGLAPDGLAAVLGEVAAALHQLNGRLATVEEWQSKLEVVQDYRLTERLRTEYKQVALDSAIRV